MDLLSLEKHLTCLQNFGTIMEMLGNFLTLFAEQLLDSLFRCEELIEVTWNKKELRDDVEKATMFSLQCGHIEAGKWRMTVEVADVDNPYIYELDMLFLDLDQDLNQLGSTPDLNNINLLSGMWSMDTVARLPLQDFYQDQKRVAAPFQSHKHKPMKGHSEKHHHKDGRKRKGILHKLFHKWIICSGGLVTLVLSGLFSFHTLYLPLRNPSRYQKRALYYSVTTVLITCLLQSLLCSFFCDNSD